MAQVRSGTPAPPRAISRFIVMAMLQAARARRLGLGRESSYSWGLNRAIFYAAAKRGFGQPGADRAPGEVPPHVEPARHSFNLGDDFAYRDTRREGAYFTIGGHTQTEADFDRQIVARFGPRERVERAWREAESIVEAVDDETLRSARGFYERVYRPRRDPLKDAWTEMVRAASGAPTAAAAPGTGAEPEPVTALPSAGAPRRRRRAPP